MAETAEQATPSVAQTAVESIKARADELRPLVEEAQELQRLLDALGAASASTRTRGRASRPSNGDSDSGHKRGGKRAEEFIALVKQNPGITIPEASKTLTEVNVNYLYRVSADLVKAGQVRKEGKGFYPVEETA